MGIQFPFTAIVGQEGMRLALLLVAVDPGIGGVLIRGEKGTAKSTMVRALASLLPSGRMRTLALGATADRLVGGLELESTLASGQARFMPGLLAQADGGVLYVDEVNLLADHLVDPVLDAAASGVVRAEREGLSRVMPARFALVGTMNPEEGQVRPQLLDRFGLCVEVTSCDDVEERVEILARRLAFDADPHGFAARWRGAEERLRADLARARGQVQTVVLPRALAERIAERAAEAWVAGHRAELVLSRAARAHAALRGADRVAEHDLEAVAELVLLHRRRQPPPPPAEAPPSPPSAPPGTPEERQSRPATAGDPHTEEVASIGEVFRVRPLPSRPGGGSGSGRRTVVEDDTGRGRHVRARPSPSPTDLALDQTLRAAAVHQRGRRGRLADDDPRRDLAILLEDGDWRRRVRLRPTGSLVVLCVDASGSMAARNRMVASKGAVLSLLLDAYVKRDRVALVSFRGAGAEVLVPPTSSIELAERRLRQLPVGGRTPLAAGLVEVGGLLRRALRKEPMLTPLVIVVTDGRGNIDLAGQLSRQATAEAQRVAGRLAGDPRVTWVVVDPGRSSRGDGAGLAAALGGSSFTLEELRADDLVALARSHHGGQSRKDRP